MTVVDFVERAFSRRKVSGDFVRLPPSHRPACNFASLILVAEQFDTAEGPQRYFSEMEEVKLSKVKDELKISSTFQSNLGKFHRRLGRAKEAHL